MRTALTPLKDLQGTLGYRFRNEALLEEALSHKSLLQVAANTRTNQRLEFLGDSVLQLVLTDELFRLHPTEREGPLSRRRAALTRGAMLATIARELGLQRALAVSPSEASVGGHDRDAALEDALEALIGAVYLDGGLDAARASVLRWFGDLDARLAAVEEYENPKGRLQEMVQPKHGNLALRYEVLNIEGEAHARRYEVAVYLFDRLLGTGRGTSKKAAEEAAAQAALGTLPNLPS